MTWKTIVVSCLTIALQCPLLLAQAPPASLDRFAPPLSPEQSLLLRLPHDPLTQSSLDGAARLLESESSVTQGLETLQQLIDQGFDFVIKDDAASIRENNSVTLLHQAEEYLKSKQPEYERLYGTAANQLLEEARKEKNVQLLEEILRRYQMTAAGAAALTELIPVLLDRGEPVLAARYLELLSQHPITKDPASHLKNAHQLLLDAGYPAFSSSLEQRYPSVFSEQADKADPAESQPDQLALELNSQTYEWRTPFGDLNHLGNAGFAPAIHDDAWRGPLVHVYDFDSLYSSPEIIEKLVEDSVQLATKTEQRLRSIPTRLTFPAARPLIVNDLIITSAPGSVKAYDIETGELQWNAVIVDQTFDYLAKQSYSPNTTGDPYRDEMRDLFQIVRGWRDLTATSLSSDGQQVYALSDCQLVGASEVRSAVSLPHSPLLPQRFNRLHAFDLKSDGKLRWSLGAPTEGWSPVGQAAQREIFFYSAPLPVNGRLYVIGEERGQIQLLEIDPASGAILWSQPLLNPMYDLSVESTRRLAGLMPAYSEGLLICPTGEGALIAIDPVKRRIVWQAAYSRGTFAESGIRRTMQPPRQTIRQRAERLLDDERWFDSRLIIAGPYVLFTPPENQHLVCVHLESGQQVWKLPVNRQQYLYAATVYNDQLILVGRNEVTSLRLSDASPAWSESIPLPPPSGRGIRMGDRFLQPLKTGEIAIIDLAAGKVLTRSALPSGTVAGNLIAANGQLINQSGSHLVGFRSESALENQIHQQLAAKENDAEGLALRGELHLQKGNLVEGMNDLRASLESESTPRVVNLLSWSLLEGLRTDFDLFRDQAKEFKPLLQNPELRMQFLKLYALGLHQQQEYLEALDSYLDLLTMLPDDQKPVDIDPFVTALNSRWTLAQIADLMKQAAPEQKESLVSKLDEWVTTCPESLFFQSVPAFPISWVKGHTILDRLSQLPIQEANRSAREAILWKLSQQSDTSERGEALVQLFELSKETANVEFSKRVLQLAMQIQDPLPLLNGKTLTEWKQEIGETPEWADLLSTAPWQQPVSVIDRPEPSLNVGTVQIPAFGPQPLSLQGWTFQFSSSRENIEIFNPEGFQHGLFPTNLLTDRWPEMMNRGRYVSLNNHLALVVLMDRFFIVDLLLGREHPRVITTRSLMSEQDATFGNRFLSLQSQQQSPPAIRSPLVSASNGNPFGSVGPLTSSVLCYVFNNELIAIEPHTGRELWKRKQIASGSEILADEECVVIIPPGKSGGYQLLSAFDGRPLGQGTLPVGTANFVERESGDWGRLLPVSHAQEGELLWRQYDPLTDSDRWSRLLPLETLWTAVQGKNVAFLTPEGEFTLCEGTTGEVLFSTNLPITEEVKGLTVLQYDDQWIIVTSSHHGGLLATRSENDSQASRPLVTVNGQVFAIDLETQQIQWSKRVDDQRMLTQVPLEWPFLIFGVAQSGRMNSLVLDRRTGETIHQATTMDDLSGIHWRAEQNPHRVHLRFGREEIVLLAEQTEDEIPDVKSDRSGELPGQKE